MMSVYVECGFISVPQGGLPGGGGNGTRTAVLDSNLADADTASQAPKMLLCKPTHGPSSSPLVTTKIDQVAGINYSLVAPLTATADSLDGQLKVRLTPRDEYPQAFVLDPPKVPPHPYLRRPLSWTLPGFLIILISVPSPCSSHNGLPTTPEPPYACSPQGLCTCSSSFQKLSPRYSHKLSLPSFQSLLKSPSPWRDLPRPRSPSFLLSLHTLLYFS